MISRRQLLSCPDQCPAKMYSLMQECWAMQPNQRPSFKVKNKKFALTKPVCRTEIVLLVFN